MRPKGSENVTNCTGPECTSSSKLAGRLRLKFFGKLIFLEHEKSDMSYQVIQKLQICQTFGIKGLTHVIYLYPPRKLERDHLNLGNYIFQPLIFWAPSDLGAGARGGNTSPNCLQHPRLWTCNFCGSLWWLIKADPFEAIPKLLYTKGWFFMSWIFLEFFVSKKNTPSEIWDGATKMKSSLTKELGFDVLFFL